MKAHEFMNSHPTTVTKAMTVEQVIKIMKETAHDGFPVIEGGKVFGIIAYEDIILQPLDKKVEEVMERRVVAIPPEMDMEAIARLMFRSGHSRFPVVDDKGNLLGLVTNSDVIRAHIERVTPLKVETLKKTLESLHNVKVTFLEDNLLLRNLIPTQGKIYKDELSAREYEITLGLAEPLLVVQNGQRYVLVDGHHRALGALRQGVEKMHCYILKLDHEVELGLEKTAEKMGLKTLDDIEILDGLSPYTLPLILENGVVKRLV
ncbi:TPA: CBS domain-containing protein [archaeon]|uniref:CBS domain-containing protein n=1 Tax=Candidatus Naiadarchaeum limnaeum TaxID=2756139 RepID=A0A832XGN6_9ARCH|nr:CBS domain-containing protein [Candidatus Naiadarchaeum limnaeum]